MNDASTDQVSKQARVLTTRQEIAGDWSGIKGTDYHVVYALWRIITQPVATKIAFYQGNDLLDRPHTLP